MSHRRVPPPCSGGMCNRAAKVTVSSTTAGEGRGPMETQGPNSRAVGAQAGRAQGGLRSSGEAPREGGARLDPRRTVEMAKGGGGAVPSSGNSVGKAARGVETRREVKTTARRDRQAETRGRIVYPWGPGGLCSTVLRRQNSKVARLAVYTARLAGVSDRVMSASPQAMLGEFHHPEKETSDPH